MFSFKTLLPNKEEARKLFFEIWKYLLLAVLGVIALLVPAIRGWVGGRISALWALSWRDITVRGWVFGVLGLCALLTLYRAVRWAIALFGGAHIRRYTQGDFDGIHWTWRWKKGRVDRLSLTPYCLKCQTELFVTPRTNQYDRVDTDIFCTQCNSGFGIVNVSDIRDHVYRKIEGNVRGGYWKTHAQKSM